ncbi:MAG: FISUMP domain-containing protein [Bacteroidota bacterium]
MKSHLFVSLFLTPILFLGLNSQAVTNINKNNFSSNNQYGFIENKGQLIDQSNNPNRAVFYLLNTPGLNVQLRRNGFSYDLYRISNIERNKDSLPDYPVNTIQQQASSIEYHRIDFNLLNFNPDYKIIVSGPSSCISNYYTTGTSVEGATFVHAYESVIYKNIYPHIDLEFLTDKRAGFKYNFVVHPGGKIQSIRLKICGAETEVTDSGYLQLLTAFGTMEEEVPHSYFIAEYNKQLVNIKYFKINDDVYGFSMDGYQEDNSLLIIDPVPTRLWATYYGGYGAGFTDSENIESVTIDKDGNIVIAGVTSSSNNIATAGAFQTSLWGPEDVFLAKFTPDGVQIWGTYYGGSGTEGGGACRCDKSGNIYLYGWTTSTNNISTPGSWQPLLLPSTNEAFLAKFTGQGNRIWGTYYGGDQGTQPYNNCSTSLSVDNNANVYFTGQTSSTYNISSPSSFQGMYGGGLYDGFLVKFDSSGQRLWGTYYGGSGKDIGMSVSVDSNDHVYLSGNTTSTNNISTPGAHQENFGGSSQGDAFLVQFNGNGQRLWGTYYGGSGGDDGESCVATNSGMVYLTGDTGSPDNIATPGAYQPNLQNNSTDAFLSKFNKDGFLIWGTYYGGDISDWAYAVEFDPRGKVFFGGVTISDNNIATPNAFQPVNGGNWDAFLVKFDTIGNRIWGTYFGGAQRDDGYAIAVDTNDRQYLAGATHSDTLIATSGAHQTVFGGQLWDGYLVKFTDCTNPHPGQIEGTDTVCLNATGVVYSIPPVPKVVSYIWSVSSGITLVSGQNTKSITVDFGNTSGPVWISVYAINHCGTGDTVYKTIIINTPPAPSITGIDTICTGPTVIYSTQAGKTQYQWSKSPGGTIISGGTASDPIISIQWNTSGAQWVRVNYTDTNGCIAPIPAQFNVWVIAGPPVDIIISTSANPICAGIQVTFTAVPINPGSNPVYQWKVNGLLVGVNNPIYNYIPSNGDVLTCILTSNLSCSSNNPATSNTITMIVNPNLPVSVSVTPTANPVCSGTLVTFTATPTYGGNTPVYQWKLNGLIVGTNSPTYAYAPLNNDVITCKLTSSETCTTGNPAISNQVTMTVNPNLPVSVSISPSANPFCIGGSVTFTATPTNGGTPPAYQWKVNGLNAGSNSPTYTYNPVSGDLVTCIMTSSVACPTGNPATSNTITMIGNTGLPAGVSITANPNPFCPGTSVTFTATPNNGGANPSYQWKVNGTNAGTNSFSFTYNPMTGDKVTCVMTSNLACVSGNPAVSNEIILSGTLAPIVSFITCFDSVTTVNAKPIKLKGGIPLNGIYSGPGVSANTFNPAAAGIGTKTITYTYTNASICSASKTKTITVQATPAFTCGNNLTDIRDGRSYATVQIGGQCWMAANLNYGAMISSSSHQRDNCINEKYCYNDLVTNCGNQTYYQWDEIMRYDDTPGLQGLCPPSWHVPTEAEWNTLFSFYINNGFAGSPLKYSGYSGFNALLSGVNHFNRQWDFQNFATFFWSSTAYGPYKAWAHGLNDYNPSVSFYPSSRTNAFSIRCTKD